MDLDRADVSEFLNWVSENYDELKESCVEIVKQLPNNAVLNSDGIVTMAFESVGHQDRDAAALLNAAPFCSSSDWAG